jgi:protoporphyrinogen/coproporphyrinogen III oxidase
VSGDKIKAKVVVAGAGISGLACAYRLKELGVDSLVLEAQERAGGAIQTMRRDGLLFEAGPQFPRFPPALWHLVGALNLSAEFVQGSSNQKRYILRNGRLHTAPFSPVALALTQLVGFRSKMRILTEAFRSSRAPLLEETLADFTKRKFGIEVLNNLVDPFASTIFLSDPCEMGVRSALPKLSDWERNHGSLVRGAIFARREARSQATKGSTANSSRPTRKLHVTKALPTLGSFRLGMSTLPEKIANHLAGSIQYNVAIKRATQLRRPSNPCGGWQLVLSDGEQIETDHLVLATPAYVSASLLAESVPRLALHLRAIEYSPMCVVSSAYHRSNVAHTLDGFGFMVPRSEKLLTRCTFWNSSMFPGRAPQGKVLITSFCRNEAGAGPGWELGGEKYVRTVERENARVLGVTGGPVDQAVWSNHKALPRYGVGHASRVGAIRDILSAERNLHLAGNFLEGRSMGDCVNVAFRAAERVHERLRTNEIEPSLLTDGVLA